MKNLKNWDRKFLDMAVLVSSWSKDQSTKVGAVLVDGSGIVRGIGYNGIPRYLNDDVQERHNRPEKYLWFNHAEMNLLNNCARIGIPTEGCTIYVTQHPCAACSRSLIQSGIKRTVYLKSSADFEERWLTEITVSDEMLNEAGVVVKFYENRNI